MGRRDGANIDHDVFGSNLVQRRLVALEELCHLGKGQPIVWVLEQSASDDVPQRGRHFRRDGGALVQLDKPFVDFAVPKWRGEHGQGRRPMSQSIMR